jgi:hypothetical protein
MQQSSEWVRVEDAPKGELGVLLTDGGIKVVGYAPYNGRGYAAFLRFPPLPDWAKPDVAST